MYVGIKLLEEATFGKELLLFRLFKRKIDEIIILLFRLCLRKKANKRNELGII